MCAAGLYGGSYVNGRYVVDGEVKRGITKRLKQKFYANYAPSEQRRSRSSKLLGTKVHRQLYHKYTCKEACSCVAMFGSKTRLAKGKFVRAFELFLVEKRLEVVGCEVVVSDGEFATGIDVLCVDAAGLYCPVEIKCGDWPHLQVARTVDGTKTMTTLPVPNSHANQHQLQLWFNVHCLRKRGVLVGSCYVVYLQSNGHFRAHPGASWWLGERGKVVEEIFQRE